MHLVKEFNDISDLLDLCRDRANKGVGMKKLAPIRQARRGIREIKKKLDNISKHLLDVANQ